MPLTNAQKQKRHRLAVKERMARYERALLWIYENSDEAEIIVRAQEALSGSECNTNSSTPTQRG